MANPGAVEITQASQARGEGRVMGSQNKEVPRKVLYIAGGALAVLLAIKLAFHGRVYA
jgi:hypothetical protein